jgi:hypothetical protein
MIDFDKAHRFSNGWARAFMSECEAEFGDDHNVVFYSTIVALVVQMVGQYDPEDVVEHLNGQLAFTNVPYRLTRIS